jgi:ATP-dependent Clp protease ATP-binding subunit ClpA
MPSSKDRRRLEVPTYIHEQLVQIARSEDRTVTSVLLELLYPTLLNYRPRWVPSKHLDKFTERARNVLTLATEEAQQLNHHYIGTEHLLLGLLREGGGVAAQALNRLGVDLDKVRAAVESKIGRGEHPAEGQIEYVPRVRTVLGLAVDEAQRLGHNSVRTEHILLGIVRDGGGVAADILDEFGVLGKVREQTLALVG